MLDELLCHLFGLDSGSLPGIDQLSDDALVAVVGTFTSHGDTPHLRLSIDETRLLEAAEFIDAPGAYIDMVGETIAHTARLFSTGYSEEDVAAGLGVGMKTVRDRRLERSLWAIDDSKGWVYPSLQFRPRSFPEQLPGLDVVFPALGDLHPAAIAGFLQTPQSELWMDGRAQTVLGWLSGGGDVDCMLRLISAEAIA